MTRKTNSIHCLSSRQAPQPYGLLSVCALIFLSQIQLSTAGYFRTSSNGNRAGYGSVSRTQRDSLPSAPTSTHEEAPRQTFKPDNEETNFFGNRQGETEEEEGEPENYDDFFLIDQTEFPSLLPPTESPAPTWEPTAQPTFEPTITTAPSTALSKAPSKAPSLQETPAADFTPLKFTASPTIAPTFVLKDVTSSPSITATSAPTQLSLDVTVTSAPTTIETVRPTDAVTVGDELENGNSQVVEETTSSPSLPPTEEEVVNITSVPTTITIDKTEAPANETTAPVVTPTDPTTDAPTDSPTVNPTTPVPSTANGYPVSGQVSLHLQGITSPFSGDTRLLFLTTAGEFIASNAVGTVEDIRVMLVYQKLVTAPDNDPSNDRRLQQEGVLRVDLGVEGFAKDETFSASAWTNYLDNLFYVGSEELVTMLQEMSNAENNPFFVSLEGIEVVDPEPINKPTLAPSQPLGSSFESEGTEGDDDDGVPMIAIIGGAVGGTLFLIIGLFLIRYAVSLQKKKRSSSSHESNSIADNFGPSPSEEDADPGSRNRRANSRNIQNKPSVEGSISSESYLTNNAAHQISYSNTMTSNSNHFMRSAAPPSEFDTMSQMGGTITDMSQMDNASYAYSLEPGIEPSVAGVPQSVAASAMSYSAYPGGSSVASGTSSYAFLKMPISHSSSGGMGSPSSLAGKPTVDVLAPPGKLGIVIDTTLDGPVVHKVNPGSALEGKINSGDIIVAIDDVDTRAMTAASITALMVKTANQRRKLTIVRS